MYEYTSDNIPKHFSKTLEKILKPNEIIVWGGVPTSMEYQESQPHIFIFGLFWIITFSFLLVIFGDDFVAKLFFIIFICAGIYLCSIPILALGWAKNTLYLITNKRAIFLNRKLISSPNIYAYNSELLKNIKISKNKNGTGNVILEKLKVSEGYEDIGFFKIPNIEKIQLLFNNILSETPSNSFPNINTYELKEPKKISKHNKSNKPKKIDLSDTQEKPAKGMLLMSMAFFIAGAMNCVFTYHDWNLNNKFIADALQTNGTIISFVDARSRPGKGSTKAKCPVVEYINNEKESIQFTHNRCSYPIEFSIGQSVEVYYISYQTYSELKAEYPNTYFTKERVSKETGTEDVPLTLIIAFFAASFLLWKSRKI